MAREAKYALLVGTSQYSDQNFFALPGVDEDLQGLSKLLQDPNLAGFEVQCWHNKSLLETRKAINKFFGNRRSSDLLILYISGHGVRDSSGDLFFVSQDTELELLTATALEASFVRRQLDSSQSRRKIVILDCCQSGAFGAGVKAASDSIQTQAALGEGKYILTATDETQFAWQADEEIDKTYRSLYTHFLIQGLQTGNADRDEDGYIGLREWHTYAYDQVITANPRQSPKFWGLESEGELLIARSVKLPELPMVLMARLEDEVVWVREAAVNQLAALMWRSTPLASSARKRMEEIAVKDDSRKIRELAQKLLSSKSPITGSSGPVSPAMEKADEPRPKTQAQTKAYPVIASSSSATGGFAAAAPQPARDLSIEIADSGATDPALRSTAKSLGWFFSFPQGIFFICLGLILIFAILKFVFGSAQDPSPPAPGLYLLRDGKEGDCVTADLVEEIQGADPKLADLKTYCLAKDLEIHHLINFGSDISFKNCHCQNQK